MTIAIVVAGCSAPRKKAPATTAGTGAEAPEVRVLWSVHAARHEGMFIKMNLPVLVPGMRLDIGKPGGASAWVGWGEKGVGPAVALYSSRILRGAVTGPAVDQLTGSPAAASDGGSFLVPLKIERGGTGARAVEHFVVTEPMPLYARVEISALQEAGTYRFPVTLTLPGKVSERAALEVVVSQVALPAEPRVLAVATTTTATLGRLFPETFGRINGRHLDRGDVSERAAVAQVDALVRAAKKAGVAFFVEDVGPEVRVDEVGRVTVDWDAYDRLMQPYMDGSAFADRMPLATWLAPAPPKRISDSPTQLRQYVAACAQHFADKGWVATPAFMHEALAVPEKEAGANAALRAEVSKMLRLHMTREMLAVTTPDAEVPQPRLWVVDDSDPRLPPVGGMGTEETVRVWPWMCAARGGNGPEGGNVKGFVWRNALASSAELEAREAAGEKGGQPLLVALTGGRAEAGNHPGLVVTPSLRMVWLEEGLQDAAMVGLLERRSDPAVVQELFAGIVGRTGLTGKAAMVENKPGAGEMPLAAPGYLYAGWPAKAATWAAVPGMLEKLVLAGMPGAEAKANADDPVYMAAKLWLVGARRPVARVGGYEMDLLPGREGDILQWGVNLVAENPVNVPVEMEARCALLPGDLDVVRENGENAVRGGRRMELPAYGIARMALPLVGHLDSLGAQDSASPVDVTERNGGAMLQVPLQVPVFRMKAVEGGEGAGAAPKIDGYAKDWPEGGSAMRVGMRFLSRPDLLSGVNRMDAAPALARWMYDRDYLYVAIWCPQTTVADERNNDWPMAGIGGGCERWWGTDGVELQLADAGPNAQRVIELGFKPGGAMMTRVAALGGKPVRWVDGAPAGGVVRYGMSVEKTDGGVAGYIVEAAIPRAWFSARDGGATAPAWRVNVLRHRGSDLASMSWSGPMVSDEDVGMMGLLVGKP